MEKVGGKVLSKIFQCPVSERVAEPGFTSVEKSRKQRHRRKEGSGSYWGTGDKINDPL